MWESNSTTCKYVHILYIYIYIYIYNIPNVQTHIDVISDIAGSLKWKLPMVAIESRNKLSKMALGSVRTFSSLLSGEW